MSCVLLVVGCGPKTEGGGESAASTSGSSGDAVTTSGTTGITGTTSVGASTSGEPTGATGATTMPPAQCPDPNSHVEEGSCFCDDGYAWCDPFDPDDLSCCELGSSTTETGDESETGDATTGEPVACDAPPPARCDSNKDGLYCQMGPGCEVEGSALFFCDDGAWHEDPVNAAMACGQGEFFNGCAADSGNVAIVCGLGPGTPCSVDDPSLCSDEVTLQACVNGKLGEISCVDACKNGTIDEMHHESGFCMLSRISAECACCRRRAREAHWHDDGSGAPADASPTRTIASLRSMAIAASELHFEAACRSLVLSGAGERVAASTRSWQQRR